MTQAHIWPTVAMFWLTVSNFRHMVVKCPFSATVSGRYHLRPPLPAATIYGHPRLSLPTPTIFNHHFLTPPSSAASISFPKNKKKFKLYIPQALTLNLGEMLKYRKKYNLASQTIAFFLDGPPKLPRLVLWHPKVQKPLKKINFGEISPKYPCHMSFFN
jgi:hypothetical protein